MKVKVTRNIEMTNSLFNVKKGETYEIQHHSINPQSNKMGHLIYLENGLANCLYLEDFELVIEKIKKPKKEK